jgi:hypothetical protein
MGCNSSVPDLPYLELLHSCSVVPIMVAFPTSRSSAPPSDEMMGWWGTDASILVSTSGAETGWAEPGGAGSRLVVARPEAMAPFQVTPVAVLESGRF